MERVIVSIPMIGLLYMQVCAVSDATDEEILKVANERNPAGTQNGWVQVIRDPEHKGAPVQCEDHKDRKHFILSC